jgi:hypothetical protein
MAKCSFDQITSSVPVGVITDLDNNILLGNYMEDNNQDIQIASIKWYVSGARVMVTRFWATSTATIILVPNIPLVSDTPSSSVPDIPKELSIEREFCLWLGYLDSIRLVTTDDLQKGLLQRVFVGIVDNIKTTGSGTGGYTAQIQARDRMKWVMDSEVFYSSQEITTTLNSTNDTSGIPRTRLIHDVMRRAIGGPPSNPQVTGISAEQYEAKKSIEYDDLSEDIGSNANSEINPSKFYSGDTKFLGVKSTTLDKVTANPKLRAITTRVSIGGEYDRTYDSNAEYASLSFLLTGQVALDVIKSLAFQEVYPTEFFQDHRDGNFYYVPRVNDSTGLNNKEFFNRTYFFNINNSEQLIYTNNGSKQPLRVSQAQDLIAFREEFSSIGMKTNFIISRSSPMSSATPHEDIVLHLATNPFSLRDVDYAPKFHRINDPTIKAVEEAAIVAISAARIFAKETNVGMAVLLGDPSLVPGEVIQVLGSPLLPKGGVDLIDSDRKKYYEWDQNNQKVISQYATFAATPAKEIAQNNYDPTNPPTSQTQQPVEFIKVQSDGSYLITYIDGSTIVAKLKPPTTQTTQPTERPWWKFWGSSDSSSTQTTNPGAELEFLMGPNKTNHFGADNDSFDLKGTRGFEESPRTIWRVDAVLHKFNLASPGYTTEIALTTPF